MFTGFICTVTHECMVSEGITRHAAEFTLSILYVTGVHAKSAVVCFSWPDENPEEIRAREPKIFQRHASPILPG